MNNLAIGRLVKQLRKEKNITMNEFAKYIDTSQPSLSRIESGNQELSFTLLAKICRELNITMSEFFFRLERGSYLQNLGDINGLSEVNNEELNEELDKILMEIISTFSIEQKKGLYTVLFPYMKD